MMVAPQEHQALVVVGSVATHKEPLEVRGRDADKPETMGRRNLKAASAFRWQCLCSVISNETRQ